MNDKPHIMIVTNPAMFTKALRVDDVFRRAVCVSNVEFMYNALRSGDYVSQDFIFRKITHFFVFGKCNVRIFSSIS